MEKKVMIKNYKNSLIEPLDEDELHILHTSYSIENLIAQIQRLVNEKAHGVYLLGGLRGIGKTSLLNLCLKEIRFGKYLRIKIDANRILNKSDFLYFIIEELYEALYDKLDDEEIKNEINDLRQIVIENRTREFNKSINLGYNKESKVIESVKEQVSFRHSLLNSIFSRQSVIENEEYLTAVNSEITKNEGKISYFERTDEFLLIDKLSKFLKRLGNSLEYTVVISIDELDKQSSLSIETIFNYFKNLLLNSHIIVFMCVDTLKYASITAGNAIDNEFKSYFTECFYMPTLEFDELVKYLYREFLITDYEDAILINYLTCGVFRKINTHQYVSKSSEKLKIAAQVFHHMLENVETSSFYDEYEYDIFKILMKEVLDSLLKYKQLSENEIYIFLANKEKEYGMKFEFTSYFIDRFSRIKTLEDFFTVDKVVSGDSSINVYTVTNLKLPLKSLINREKITFDNEFMGRSINQSVNVSKCIPVLIEKRNVEAFYYFERFVQTLYSKIENVIIIEKISNWNEGKYKFSQGL